MGISTTLIRCRRTKLLPSGDKMIARWLLVYMDPETHEWREEFYAWKGEADAAQAVLRDKWGVW